MKSFLKRRLTFSDIFLILINIIPVWGVWYRGWNATEVFIIYCMESIIMGIYNIIMMFVSITWQKKHGLLVKPTESNAITGYGLILFFIIHYGIFLFIQLSIFISVSEIDSELGDFGAFAFVANMRDYLSTQMQWVLLLFVASYGIVVLKDFIFNGLFKKALAEKLVFAPYARIFVQQFCVILGGMFLTAGAGKVFILIFVIVKLYFENMLDYNKMVSESAKAA